MKDYFLYNKIEDNVTLSLLNTFKDKCPNYKDLSIKSLIENYNVFQYFHNPNGPAVINHNNKLETYFANTKNKPDGMFRNLFFKW